jgi:protein CpxP
MKTWIKRSLTALLGATVLAGGLAACGHRDPGARWAQASPEDAAKWRARLIEKADARLQLDEAQEQRLGVLFDKMNEQRQALVGSSGDPRAAMQQLLTGPNFDRAGATALIGEKTDAVRAKSPEVVNAMADFFDSLNPQQQAQVREFLAKRHGRRG